MRNASRSQSRPRSVSPTLPFPGREQWEQEDPCELDVDDEKLRNLHGDPEQEEEQAENLDGEESEEEEPRERDPPCEQPPRPPRDPDYDDDEEYQWSLDEDTLNSEAPATSHKLIKYLYIRNVDEPAYIHAQSTARVMDVLFYARRQKHLAHSIKAYPSSATLWMHVDYLTATGGRLPANLREGRWAPWEHLQSTRTVALYRQQALQFRAMFSEHTSYPEILDRLRNMVDWEFDIKLQVFPSGIVMATEDSTTIGLPRGGHETSWAACA